MHVVFAAENYLDQTTLYKDVQVKDENCPMIPRICLVYPVNFYVKITNSVGFLGREADCKAFVSFNCKLFGGSLCK